MDKIQLALVFPGTDGPIQNNPAVLYNPDTTTLGGFITTLGPTAIAVGGFLMFFWASWGVFDYIRAEGNKEALAKARKRIQWAIAGFIILILSFFLSDTIKSFLQPGLPPLTTLELKELNQGN